MASDINQNDYITGAVMPDYTQVEFEDFLRGAPGGLATFTTNAAGEEVLAQPISPPTNQENVPSGSTRKYVPLDANGQQADQQDIYGAYLHGNTANSWRKKIAFLSDGNLTIGPKITADTPSEKLPSALFVHTATPYDSEGAYLLAAVEWKTFLETY